MEFVGGSWDVCIIMEFAGERNNRVFRGIDRSLSDIWFLTGGSEMGL